MKKFLIILSLINCFFCKAISLDPVKQLYYTHIARKDSGEKNKFTPTVANVAVITIDYEVDFKDLQKKLMHCFKSPDIHGVILCIDNSGGSFSDYSTIHDLIKKVNESKPVVAFVQSAFSCGYLITSACRYIVTNSMPFIGGIGVVHDLSKVKNRKIKNNVEEADFIPTVFTAGKYKAVFANRYNELTEHDKEYIQERCIVRYNLFLQKIAENRKLSLSEAKDWADSKIFEATEALNLKLIDEIGTLVEVEQRMLEFIRKENSAIVYADEVKLIPFDADNNQD